MRAIIFDAFGTLFRVTSGGSAKTIMKNITDCGNVVDEKAFLEEWKSYYKNHTLDNCEFMTERDIFIARIQMFYDRYNVSRNAENDADSLLAGAFEREAYPEIKTVWLDRKGIGGNVGQDYTITDLNGLINDVLG